MEVLLALVVIGILCWALYTYLPRYWFHDEPPPPPRPPMQRTVTPRAAELLAARSHWGQEHPEKVVEGCDVSWCPRPAEVRAVFVEGELLFCHDHIPDIGVVHLEPYDEGHAA